MTARSADPLTAATTTFWAPLLKSYGFRRYGKRSFGRVVDDCIFQYIDLQLSAFGGRDFAVNHASLLLSRPREHVGSTTFRRLPKGKSNDGWWSAKSLDLANRAMEDVCEKTANIAVPWFNRTSTANGLALELLVLGKVENPHTFFELGCCYATLGELVLARKTLDKAMELFQRIYDEIPRCTWALEQRGLVEKLSLAIKDGIHATLLSTWRDQTFDNLKLEKVT